MINVIATTLIVSTLLVAGCSVTVGDAEYKDTLLSGHPNYIEPSTFPTYRVPKGAITLGPIKPWPAITICASIEDGDTIILSSGGGYVMAGNAIIQCIKDKDVTIAVKAAYSMATTVLLAGAKVCMYEGAPLGYHMPYKMLFGVSVPLTAIELEAVYIVERAQLRNLGYSEAVIQYLEAFGEISSEPDKLAMMPHGTLAGILGDRFVGRCI